MVWECLELLPGQSAALREWQKHLGQWEKFTVFCNKYLKAEEAGDVVIHSLNRSSFHQALGDALKLKPCSDDTCVADNTWCLGGYSFENDNKVECCNNEKGFRRRI